MAEARDQGSGIREIPFHNGENYDKAILGFRTCFYLKGKLEVQVTEIHDKKLIDLRIGGPRGGGRTGALITVPMAGKSDMEILGVLAGVGLALLRIAKANKDFVIASREMDRRIQEGPRPSREEAGLN